MIKFALKMIHYKLKVKKGVKTSGNKLLIDEFNFTIVYSYMTYMLKKYFL